MWFSYDFSLENFNFFDFSKIVRKKVVFFDLEFYFFRSQKIFWITIPIQNCMLFRMVLFLDRFRHSFLANEGFEKIIPFFFTLYSKSRTSSPNALLSNRDYLSHSALDTLRVDGKLKITNEFSGCIDSRIQFQWFCRS